MIPVEFTYLVQYILRVLLLLAVDPRVVAAGRVVHVLVTVVRLVGPGLARRLLGTHSH